MGKNSRNVIILDSEKRFLEYTNPGHARLLLRVKKAKVYSRDPFAIMLMKSVSINSIRRKKRMVKPRNFTEFFKEEQDIYVQNLSNSQISITFPMSNGKSDGFLFPNTRDPLNLTQFVPFQAIKNSMIFRKMLNRRPPVLQIITQDEYEAFYKRKAQNSGLIDAEGKPDIDAAIDSAEERRLRTTDRNLREYVTEKAPEPIHEVIEKGTGPGGMPKFGEKQRVASMAEAFSEDDIINPKVLHYCNQVKAEIPSEERMPAAELLGAIQDIPNLKLDDYEYIRAHGYYKSVKKWAKEEAGKAAKDHEETDG